jgi:hypothetical protein
MFRMETRAAEFALLTRNLEKSLMSVSAYLSQPENLPDAVDLLTRIRPAVETVLHEKMKKRGVKVRMRRAGIDSERIATFLRDKDKTTLEVLFRMYSTLNQIEREERQG